MSLHRSSCTSGATGTGSPIFWGPTLCSRQTFGVRLFLLGRCPSTSRADRRVTRRTKDAFYLPVTPWLQGRCPSLSEQTVPFFYKNAAPAVTVWTVELHHGIIELGPGYVAVVIGASNHLFCQISLCKVLQVNRFPLTDRLRLDPSGDTSATRAFDPKLQAESGHRTGGDLQISPAVRAKSAFAGSLGSEVVPRDSILLTHSQLGH